MLLNVCVKITCMYMFSALTNNISDQIVAKQYLFTE